MRILSHILVIILACLVSQSVTAQSANEFLISGDARYQAGDFGSAEELYRKATQQESSLASNYNLGNATYQQERYEEAVDYYMNAAKKTESLTQESDAMYNLGNAYFNSEKLEEAIDAYKQAIRLNPDNKEAKYNLAICKEIMKQAKQQPQDQQQQQENQDQENQDQENQEESDQEQEQQENQDQENQDSGDKEEEKEQEEQEEEKQDSTQQQEDGGEANFDSTRLEKQTLDSLDAAKLLQIIQSEELKVQEKLRKWNGNRKKPEKDW